MDIDRLKKIKLITNKLEEKMDRFKTLDKTLEVLADGREVSGEVEIATPGKPLEIEDGSYAFLDIGIEMSDTNKFHLMGIVENEMEITQDAIVKLQTELENAVGRR